MLRRQLANFRMWREERKVARSCRSAEEQAAITNITASIIVTLIVLSIPAGMLAVCWIANLGAGGYLITGLVFFLLLGALGDTLAQK